MARHGSTTAEIAGVSLGHVAREIIGDIPLELTKFDTKEKKNVKKEGKVKDPIAVFFPKGQCLVLSRERAEKQGFLNRPEVMNIDSVTGSDTAAGRYKNAMDIEGRQQAWMDLEQQLINECLMKSGPPFPAGCSISEQSLYFGNQTREIEV